MMLKLALSRDSKRAQSLPSLRASLVPSICAFFLTTLTMSASMAAPDKKPLVYVKKAELTELSEQLTYPARVEPRIRASVIAEADGIVTQILAPLGSTVSARGKLLVIRNTDPVYRYSPLTITSPVAGIVSRVDVTEGNRVSRGDKLALVTDPSQVRVVVEVTASDVSSIRPGLEADLQIPGAVESEPVKLTVKGISPFVDPATGTASCELEVSSSSGQERAASGLEKAASEKKTEPGQLAKRLPPPGSIARVTFRVNVRKGFSIPDSSITYRGKSPFVRIVTSGKAKLVPVVLGRKQAGFVEILKGLKAGDQVVERTSAFVADGEDVEIPKEPSQKPEDAAGATGEPAQGQKS